MSFSAVVLAGGSGSRMGCDKAMLTFEGRPLIRRVVDTLGGDALRGLFDEILVVGRDPRGLGGFGANSVLPDDVPGRGPLGGIATGLTHMKSDRGLFVACDMPLLEGGAIAGLVREAGAVDADAIVPVHDGDLEPLHAVYAKTCLPVLARQFESGDLRVRALFEEVRTRYWDVSAAGFDVRCFTNVNTRADLEALGGFCE